MKRPAHHRIGAALLAFLLVLVEAGELFSAHPCTLHDPALYTANSVEAGAEASHHHGAAEHANAAHGDSEGHEAPCTCQGACVTPTPAALPEDASITVPAVIDRAPAARFVANEVVLPRFTPYFLPFSQAPPSLS